MPDVRSSPSVSDPSSSPARACPSVSFSGHNAYIASVARMCREGNVFTDVSIIAQDGCVAAHRWEVVRVGCVCVTLATIVTILLLQFQDCFGSLQ